MAADDTAISGALGELGAFNDRLRARALAGAESRAAVAGRVAAAQNPDQLILADDSGIGVRGQLADAFNLQSRLVYKDQVISQVDAQSQRLAAEHMFDPSMYREKMNVVAGDAIKQMNGIDSSQTLSALAAPEMQKLVSDRYSRIVGQTIKYEQDKSVVAAEKNLDASKASMLGIIRHTPDPDIRDDYIALYEAKTFSYPLLGVATAQARTDKFFAEAHEAHAFAQGEVLLPRPDWPTEQYNNGVTAFLLYAEEVEQNRVLIKDAAQGFRVANELRSWLDNGDMKRSATKSALLTEWNRNWAQQIVDSTSSLSRDELNTLVSRAVSLSETPEDQAAWIRRGNSLAGIDLLFSQFNNMTLPEMAQAIEDFDAVDPEWGESEAKDIRRALTIRYDRVRGALQGDNPGDLYYDLNPTALQPHELAVSVTQRLLADPATQALSDAEFNAKRVDEWVLEAAATAGIARNFVVSRTGIEDENVTWGKSEMAGWSKMFDSADTIEGKLSVATAFARVVALVSPDEQFSAFDALDADVAPQMKAAAALMSSGPEGLDEAKTLLTWAEQGRSGALEADIAAAGVKQLFDSVAFNYMSSHKDIRERLEAVSVQGGERVSTLGFVRNAVKGAYALERQRNPRDSVNTSFVNAERSVRDTLKSMPEPDKLANGRSMYLPQKLKTQPDLVAKANEVLTPGWLATNVGDTHIAKQVNDPRASSLTVAASLTPVPRRGKTYFVWQDGMPLTYKTGEPVTVGYGDPEPTSTELARDITGDRPALIEALRSITAKP